MIWTFPLTTPALQPFLSALHPSVHLFTPLSIYSPTQIFLYSPLLHSIHPPILIYLFLLNPKATAVSGVKQGLYSHFFSLSSSSSEQGWIRRKPELSQGHRADLHQALHSCSIFQTLSPVSPHPLPQTTPKNNSRKKGQGHTKVPWLCPGP